MRIVKALTVFLTIIAILCSWASAESVLSPEDQTREYDPELVQITAEYQMDISGSAFYFIVIKNIAPYDLSLEMNVDAIGENGEILDSTKTREHAVSPGAEIVLIPRFVRLPLNEVTKIEYVLTSKKSEYYYGVNTQMETSYEQIDDGIRIKMTNTGITPVKYPQAYVLFFRDGDLIDFDGTALFYGNGTSILEAGETKEKDAHCYKIYDDVKIYTSGEWE